MKKLKLVLCMLILGVMMVGCSTSKLGEVYEEDKLKADGENVVAMLCEGDYESLDEKMSENMKKEDAIKVIKDAWEPVYDKLGKFESVGKIAVVGNNDLATVVILGEFESGKCQFTMHYNEEMQIEGFFMK